MSRVYLDGVLVGSAAGAGPIAYNGTQFLRLSRWGGGGRHWNGQLDEVDIYDRALTAAEIAAIFNAGSAGKCKPKVLLCQSNPIDGIDNAISDINDLGLDPGTTATLVQKLQEAKDKFILGDLHDARSKVYSFVVEIEAAVDAGNLVTEEANVLLNQAGCILAGMKF